MKNACTNLALIVTLCLGLSTREAVAEVTAAQRARILRLEQEIQNRAAIKAATDLGLTINLQLNPIFAGIKTDTLIKGYRDEIAQVTGPDNRTDVKFPSSFQPGAPPVTLDGILVTPAVQRNLAGVAAIMTDTELTFTGSQWALTSEPYYKKAGVCPEITFAHQPAAAHCTAFLVKPRVVATAGHCEDQIPANKMLFVFGFRGDGNSFPATFGPDDVYRGVRVLKKNVGTTSDWALIELERDVVGPVPLELDPRHSVTKGDAVYVVGHPAGLPLKLAAHATVSSVSKDSFSADLDVLGGNSGSPVFLESTHRVIGIYVNGIDGYQTIGDCKIIKPCAATRTEGCDGEGCTRISEVPELTQASAIIAVGSGGAAPAPVP